MRHVRRIAFVFIMAWGNLLNFAPGPTPVKIKFETERNTLAAHFNSVWGYLGKAIDAEKSDYI